MLQAYEKLVTLAIKERVYDEEGLKKLKRKIAREFGISMPRNEEIRENYFRLLKQRKVNKSKRFEENLVLKKTRTLSGVSVVAVLTKDYPCRGKCLYCPCEKEMPKSYLSCEPAVMRAIRLKFNPYWQVKKRIEVLEYNGHNASKIELIIMGGTFSHLPEKYQYWFVLNCFKAANDMNMNRANNGLIDYSVNLQEIKRLLGKEKRENSQAEHRIVGLTLETRPDELNIQELKKYRRLGCTRVEIGVQSLSDKVLRKNKRGHGTREVRKATRLLKDMAYKINYHVMPGLWGSNFAMDLAMFKELFSDPRYRPDMLKIYPCVVTKDSGLYKLWKRGKYRPYSNKELRKLIVEIKRIIPSFVRLTRLIRDIPTSAIVAGPNIPNLRGILREKGITCCCIRCREVGRSQVKKGHSSKIFLERINYDASEGKEIFLQFVSGKEKLLHAFLRLRISSNTIRGRKPLIPELENCTLIREMHSYGIVAPIGKRFKKTSQHKGLGKKLIKEAKRITKDEFKLSEIAVIASEGTKEYYRKLGFRERGLYMVGKTEE